MGDLDKIRHILQLKEVDRARIPVKNRIESTAEHTWGCLILAQYFLNEYDIDVDRQRVMQLLLYHDLIEIETGDVDFMDTKNRKNKAQKEAEALVNFKERIPNAIKNDYVEAFEEYEKKESKEAQFANAIDKIEPMLHLLEYPHKFKEHGVTEQVLKEKKEIHMKPFPQMLQFYTELVTFLRENNRLA